MNKRVFGQRKMLRTFDSSVLLGMLSNTNQLRLSDLSDIAKFASDSECLHWEGTNIFLTANEVGCIRLDSLRKLTQVILNEREVRYPGKRV